MNLTEFLKTTPDEIFKCFIEKASDLGLQFIYKNKHYLYIKGNTNIALTSHVDTVDIYFEPSDKDIVEKNGIIVAYRNNKRCILGGDDRVGVHICYERLSKPKENIPHILLFNGEEVGGIGSNYFCSDNINLDDIDLMISLDACYNNEFVWYGNNRSADHWVESFGWKNKGRGIFSDIMTIGENYNFPCVNLGVGYFNQHTAKEYIDIEIMELTKRKLERMLSVGFIPNKID